MSRSLPLSDDVTVPSDRQECQVGIEKVWHWALYADHAQWSVFCVAVAEVAGNAIRWPCSVGCVLRIVTEGDDDWRS